MEDARYRMWMKRKHVPNLHFQATRNNNSWEEQAFQKDACESFRGYMWPPRSYSCSFCKREFRSAQALGGHMNVHRRDRARLKQSSLSPRKELKPSNVQNPSHICALLYDHDPGPRASASSSQDELEKDASKADSICLSCIEPKLYMCSNLVICQNRSSWSDEDDHDATVSCKRTKTENYLLPFFNKPCLSNRSYQNHSEIIGINASSLEDLDLELRLGDPPEVK